MNMTRKYSSERAGEPYDFFPLLARHLSMLSTSSLLSLTYRALILTLIDIAVPSNTVITYRNPCRRAPRDGSAGYNTSENGKLIPHSLIPYPLPYVRSKQLLVDIISSNTRY